MASYIDLNDLGSFASINALWAAHPEGGQEGDYCTIAGVKYRWDKYDRMWVADPNFGPTPARSVTTFDGDVIMQNNLTVAGYIRAKGIKQPCLGLYLSEAALKAKWPDPEVGMWALVGDSISIDTPADVYRCDTDGTWAATGGTAYIDGLEINVANGITGWVPISGTSQLPADPTPGQQGKGYLLGTMLYVYVGTGGDTLSGKYQSAQLKGLKGDKGDKGDNAIVLPGEYSAYIADNLTTDDSEMILSAKQGVVLKDLVDSLKAALLDTDDVEDIPVEIIDPNVVRFNDPVAEAIALENWDTNHDGKITLDEAAEVTDYSTLFKGEDIITTEWMGSFPNVTSIGSTSAFQQCLALTNIVIPSNITSIANMAFNGCTAATSISLAEGLVTIGQQCFKNCAFSSVIIPSTVTTIKYNAFSLSALTTVICKATTPPSCDSTAYKIFNTTGITAIYVPAASVDTYKAHQDWSPWASVIQAIPTT